MNESGQRINEILRDYWQRLRKGRKFPSETDIDPDAIGDIWGSCFLVQVSPQAVKEHKYRYAYLGISLIEAFGDDVMNQDVSARLIDPANASLIEHFEKVVKTEAPVEELAEFTNRRGMLIKYRTCLLPIGNAGSGIDYIIGGMKWKAF